MIYDKSIAEILAGNRGYLVVSVDAGTRETFYKVKGVDAFDRVCDTLRRYSDKSEKAIYLKYIFLPGVNDNKAEVDSFFALATDVKAARVIISSDKPNPHLVNSHVISMAEYFLSKAKEYAIVCETYSNVIENALKLYNPD